MTRPLWRVASSADVLAEMGALVDVHSLLGPKERERHDRLRQAVDREDFVAARLLTRLLILELDELALSESTLCAVQFEQRCVVCGGPHGRPTVVGAPELGVSWAHAKGVVAAAVAPGAVGIDVERAAAEPPPEPAGATREPWLAWTRAEAITKLGVADLETSLSWTPHLDWPASTGRDVVLPDGREVWFGDERHAALGVVCSVARPARPSPAT